MINFLNIFRKSMRPAESVRKVPDANNSENDTPLNERLKKIYGEDTLQLQALYEKYVTRELWSVRDEAVWLISGIDPAHSQEVDDETRHKINGLWEHARHCAEQGLLEIANPGQEPELWEASPVNIYRWATVSRFDLPAVFENLMGFVAKSIQSTKLENQAASAGNGGDETAGIFDRDREAVLGMALAILAAYPEQCKSSSGRIKVDKIIAVINDKEEFWLGGEKTSLSPVAMRDLINKWLMTVRP